LINADGRLRVRPRPKGRRHEPVWRALLSPAPGPN
jgi:hypothetical protein